MNYLANTLKKYYFKQKGKILFQNKKTLNQLALQMWEESDFSSIDASVLSKVISGERIFTPKQLTTFCKIMNISGADKEYLFYCLEKDYNLKKETDFNRLFIPSDALLETVRNLEKEANNLFFTGKCIELERVTCIAQSLIEEILIRSFNSIYIEPLSQIYRNLMYLQAQAIGSTRTPKNIFQDTFSSINKAKNVLLKLNKYKDTYDNVTLANAYYVHGKYQKINSNRSLREAISLAEKAMKTLPENDSEYLFALRTQIASSIVIKDKLLFSHCSKKAKKILPIQPEQNYLKSINLMSTIILGHAYFFKKDKSKYKKLSEDYFGKTLKGTRIFEVSDIKNELEMAVILKIRNDKNIKNHAKRAIKISKSEGFERHLATFNNFLSQL